MILTKIRFKPLFGNTISFSNKKTRRKFNLNYKKVKLWSFVLKQFIKIRTSVKLLKTIKKYGGVDFYIINFKRLPKQFAKLKAVLLSTLLS
ncbi:MAG: bL28 family ribosomal protein [Candidatus Hodgkinia cicadicola]